MAPWRAAFSAHRKCGRKLPEALSSSVCLSRFLEPEVAQLMDRLAHIKRLGAQCVHEQVRMQFPGKLRRGVLHRDIKPANIMAADLAEPARPGPHRFSRTLDKQPPFQAAHH